MILDPAVVAAAQRAQAAARDNWPKNGCPGRGRQHPISETYSCPWCLPASFYQDVAALEANRRT